MPITICVSLEEDSTRGIFGGIGYDSEGDSEAWEVEDGL